MPSIYTPSSIIEECYYLLQLNDEFNRHTWKVELSSLKEPTYIQKDILKNGRRVKQTEPNGLHIKIKSIDYSRGSILKRVVFIEKCNCKKKAIAHEDPLINWSYKQMFSSNFFSNTLNFVLHKLNQKEKVISTWMLKDCALTDSTVWRDSHFFETHENDSVIEIKLFIQPENFIQIL